MRVGIIGATGWLGSALGQHLLSGRVVPAEALVLLNRSGPRADYHGHRPHWAADVAELAALSDVIVVSVRPEDWHGLALQAPGKLVLSFMAGVGADLLAASGGRIVRAMPNAAAESGHSYSPFWAAPGVTPEDREAVRRILGAIGTTDELPAEAQIDLMTALPGSGAAYPALMAMAMADFMTGHGVPETVTWRAVEAAVCGGAAMLAGRPQRAVELVAAYRDYRGTTAAGIEAAEAAGFPQAVARALEVATEKARRLVAPAPT
ncbi:pyrroline-5-carboxylate reductase family protein [Paracoccus sp. DMF]|uniref:pyrroline-5-carboxylate reductase family protein n=1 Tax=Paracoccus sp. DMF TaxID=400837 RepID=UPI0021E4C329|nr:pyrroline-5-carboxylate reductase dimerization domain-containing protein [Paracoccus sp. DMF]MCV2445770.1 NAD(P)-binding domain-containing protein [Paracoccus sp. DMF]